MTLRAAILAGFLAMTAVGCGKDASPTGPSQSQSAYVNFRLDSNSCASIFGTQTLNFTFFVDGITVGATSLGIGITSPPYSVTPGTHVASASVTNTTLRFVNLNFSVAPGGTFTYILLC